MSRIRSIKPQWLDDERMGMCSDTARMVSVALITIADDHGNGKAHPMYLGSRIWPYSEDLADVSNKLAASLRELAESGFLRLYEVKNQKYFNILNWSKHQRITNAGKSMVPFPEGGFGPVENSSPRNSASSPNLCANSPTLCTSSPLDKEKEKEEEKEREEERGRPPNSKSEQIQNQGLDADPKSAQGPAHEPPAPSYDPEDRTPHQRLCDLVREKHRAWHIGVDPLGQPPRMPQGYGKHVAAIAEDIASAPDPSARLDLLFAGFERDEWCKGNGYPMGALANNPPRYAKPASHSFAVPDGSDPSIHDGRDDSPGYRSDERGRTCSL